MKIEGQPKNCKMEGQKCVFLNEQKVTPICEMNKRPLVEVLRCGGPYMTIYRHLLEVKK